MTQNMNNEIFCLKNNRKYMCCIKLSSYIEIHLKSELNSIDKKRQQIDIYMYQFGE